MSCSSRKKELFTVQICLRSCSCSHTWNTKYLFIVKIGRRGKGGYYHQRNDDSRVQRRDGEDQIPVWFDFLGNLLGALGWVTGDDEDFEFGFVVFLKFYSFVAFHCQDVICFRHGSRQSDYSFVGFRRRRSCKEIGYFAFDFRVFLLVFTVQGTASDWLEVFSAAYEDVKSQVVSVVVLVLQQASLHEGAWFDE